MFIKFSGFINRISVLRNLIISSAVILLSSNVVLPWWGQQLEGYMQDTTQDTAFIDLMFRYTPGELYEVVEGYSEQGRQVYALGSATFDVVHPIAYAFFYAIVITYTFRRLFAPQNPLQRLHLVPFGAMLADILENASIIAILLSYPQRLVGLAWLAGLFTTAKWILACAAIGLALLGIVGSVSRWIIHRLSKEN